MRKGKFELTYKQLRDENSRLKKEIASLREQEHREHGCQYCEDLDQMAETVCYIPTDRGGAIDIPVNYCPMCGRKLEDAAV